MIAQRSGLPYDAEVEYLESDGNQYIDTEFKNNQDTRFLGKFKFTEYKQWAHLFGSFGGVRNSSKVFCEENYSNTQVQTYYGPTSGTKRWTLNPNTGIYIYDLNKNIHTINGNKQTYTARTFQSNYNVFVFCSAGYSGEPSGIARCRCYYFRIYDNGTLVRDMIPVRVGQVGYMYDKISKKLYGNEGTGDFTFGSDKLRTYDAEVEYIESTGTQYINTWFTNTLNTEFVIDFQLTDSTGDRKIIGQGGKLGLGQISSCWRTIGTTWYQTDIPTDTNRHIARTDRGKYYLDSTLLADRAAYNASGTSPMLLFAASLQDSVMPDGNTAIMKLYSCQIYDNGVLVRDYIPVRVGQVGYLYDKISKELFSNEGTGDFIIGNDINS